MNWISHDFCQDVVSQFEDRFKRSKFVELSGTWESAAHSYYSRSVSFSVELKSYENTNGVSLHIKPDSSDKAGNWQHGSAALKTLMSMHKTFSRIENVQWEELEGYRSRKEELFPVNQLSDSLGPILGSQLFRNSSLEVSSKVLSICSFMRVCELQLKYEGKESEDFLERQMATGNLQYLILSGIWPQTLYPNFLRLLENDTFYAYEVAPQSRRRKEIGGFKLGVEVLEVLMRRFKKFYHDKKGQINDIFRDSFVRNFASICSNRWEGSEEAIVDFLRNLKGNPENIRSNFEDYDTIDSLLKQDVIIGFAEYNQDDDKFHFTEYFIL